jgi:hypothetical protein
MASYTHEPLTAIEPIPEEVVDMSALPASPEPDQRRVPQDGVEAQPFNADLGDLPLHRLGSCALTDAAIVTD